MAKFQLPDYLNQFFTSPQLNAPTSTYQGNQDTIPNTQDNSYAAIMDGLANYGRNGHENLGLGRDILKNFDFGSMTGVEQQPYGNRFSQPPMNPTSAPINLSGMPDGSTGASGIGSYNFGQGSDYGSFLSQDKNGQFNIGIPQSNAGTVSGSLGFSAESLLGKNPPGKDPSGWQFGGSKLNGALNGLQTIGQLWGAYQTNKMARKQLSFAKDAFETNVGNQIKTYNTSLSDRAHAREGLSGNSPEQVRAYIESNKLVR